MYRPSGVIKPVPGSKEDVFKTKDLSLLDKRRLMRFLLFAAGDFEASKELDGKGNMAFPTFLESEFKLKDEIAEFVVYALAFCSRPSGNLIRPYIFIS